MPSASTCARRIRSLDIAGARRACLQDPSAALAAARFQNIATCVRLRISFLYVLLSGKLDVQRALYNLHRRNLPLEKLHEKAKEYIEADPPLIDEASALAMIRAIEAERGTLAVLNENAHPAEEGSPALVDALPLARLSSDEMRELLHKRERQMQDGGDPSNETDQWRVYRYIVKSIEDGRYLRLMVQASAGTGKSFLLTTVFLWCLVRERSCQLGTCGEERSHQLGSCRAACPTGIAASNIELAKTSVSACTLHSMLELESDRDGTRSKLDFSKPGTEKVAALLKLQVLLLDEVRLGVVYGI